MKRLILAVFCAVVTFVCPAQNNRVVNGAVFTADGAPLSVAVLKAVGTELTFTPGADGRFQIQVPYYVKMIEASAEGYLTEQAEIDGSYIVFRMKIDKKYAEQKASEEKAAAEAAAAKAKAEEEARIAAEKAAEAKRVAEEKAAAAKAKAEAKAKKIAKRKEIDKAYNAKYRNKGLIHSFELSYGYQSGKENVIYKNLGYREYGSFHPIEATYTIGYRFCNWVSLGLGAGVSYNLVNLCTYGDVFDPMYEGADKFTPINIPVFLNSTVYMSRGKCQPMLSVSGGVYAPNLELLADFGVGCNLRLSKRGNMYFLASIRTTPYAFFVEESYGFDYYQSSSYYSYFVWTPSFKIGFTF